MTRAGTAADLARVAEIQSASPEATQWRVTDSLPYAVQVAERDGAVAGFSVYRATDADEWELLNIAVAPEFRRRGVARELLAALPGGRIFIEVRASNMAARGLYESAGFRQVGVRRRYYHSPVEDGIVMEFQK